MIRFLVLGIAAIAATLGGAFAAQLLAVAGSAQPKPQAQVALEVVRLEAVSVPVVRQGRVQGYVIARVGLTAPADELKRDKPILVAYASEAVLRAIYGEEAFDFTAMKPTDLAALADRVTRLANARLGRPVVTQSVIEGLSFVAKGETRKAGGR